MNQRTLPIRSGLRLVALAATALLVSIGLSGCSTYYQSYYPDSGVYYGDSGVYGHSYGYSRGGYGPVNPVDYPYWSIDYFYFSQYYHPYSVYVGYSEPLYYPYPGWALGYYRPARWHGSLAFGFGYPWYGYGYRYPAYTFGFFSNYDPYYYGGHHRRNRHGHDRIRQIDRRLEALQHGDSYVSRRELLGRDRLARRGGDRVYDTRGSNRGATQSQSRADLLRQRNSATSRTLQSRTVAPDNRRIQRRAPDVRSERRSSRRVLDRDRIRRDGGASAYEGHRGVPIENLRGRIVNSQRGRSGQSPDRNDALRDRAGIEREIRRAPAVDWSRDERRSGQASGGNRNALINRSPGGFGAPPARTDRRPATAPRASRDAGRDFSRGSRPSSPPPRASAPAPTRRAIMRDRSGEGGRHKRRR